MIQKTSSSEPNRAHRRDKLRILHRRPMGDLHVPLSPHTTRGVILSPRPRGLQYQTTLNPHSCRSVRWLHARSLRIGPYTSMPGCAVRILEGCLNDGARRQQSARERDGMHQAGHGSVGLSEPSRTAVQRARQVRARRVRRSFNGKFRDECLKLPVASQKLVLVTAGSKLGWYRASGQARRQVHLTNC